MYTFEPRWWVEAAIRAGHDPYAIATRSGARFLQICEDVDARYEPPRLAARAERAAVIVELIRRGHIIQREATGVL